jgi:glyoxylase-like metal-dependent hydrolase (beta-lactamase superfamily II)
MAPLRWTLLGCRSIRKARALLKGLPELDGNSAAKKIETFPVGPFQMNCYLAYDEASKKGVILDPGDEVPMLLARIQQLKLELSHILLTHGHIDHVAFAEDMHRALGVPMLLHRADWDMARNAPKQAMMFGLAPGPVPEIDGELPVQKEFAAGPFVFETRHTPGHSPGSVTLINHHHKVAFVGDVVFQGSIGRTDLPGGNHRQLLETIRREILTLPDDFRLLSGHGPATTVAAERRSNPFLQGLG